MNDNKVYIEVNGTFDYSIEQLSVLYEKVFTEQSPINFFLSVEWISNWLNCAENKPELIQFIENDKVVGFVFVGVVNTSLGNVFYLNQTGNTSEDQIWIEYNDVICRAHHNACRIALMAYIANKANCFQFVGINTLVKRWKHDRWSLWSMQAIDGYKVQFTDDSSNIHFSKNTKSQISRSVSLIEKEFGAINMHWVDKNQIESALNEMSEKHINQWGKHEYGSGFNNPKFVAFHRKMLEQGIGKFAHIAKYTAGEQTLGYLYFFTYNKKVFFYLSAINYQHKSNKYKPGLVMHKLAMSYFHKLGYTEYDFLAGHARYKTSLSNQQYMLFNIKLYAQKWYYWPLKKLVNLKRWVKQLSSKHT